MHLGRPLAVSDISRSLGDLSEELEISIELLSAPADPACPVDVLFSPLDQHERVAQTGNS